jgi:hypothetical protein
MNAEDYATNDTAHGGANLTPADIEEMDRRDRLVAAIRAEQEQEEILQASRSVRAGTDMLFAALRKSGVFR